jgi:Alpha mannosidase middle domain
MLDAVGIANHHDAITGTCKQVVADDYAYRINHALEHTRSVAAEIV